MARSLAWMELTLAIVLLLLAIWTFSGFCSGRALGFDCESWAIFGVNVFAPLGMLALISAIFYLTKKVVMPQYILLLGFVLLMVFWFSNI
ncbi:MAG: hypothetical protein RLT30_06680 [Gammaproteobacteria bacterium]